MNERREELRTLLTQHAPACDEEAVHRDRMLALLDSPGDPMSREHYDPGHFTASGFVLSPDGGSVLLILHRKLNRWLQPGGHVDPGDADLFAAACREILEEVGIAMPQRALPGGIEPGVFDVDIHAIPARKAEPAHEHFDVRFLLRAPTTAIDANDESHDAEWVRFADLTKRMTAPDELRVIQKLRALEGQLPKINR
jgi:8-oxo-dGTP pyrophosphatase MutT (NUDIX family)